MMYRKISFALVLLGTQGVTEKAYANPNADPGACAKPFQLYVGVSGGVNRMTGRRNEMVTNYPNPDQPVNIFSNNLYFANKNVHYSAIAGFTWNIFNLPLFIGPEIHLGQTSTQSEQKASVVYVVNDSVRTMQTFIQQSGFVGGSVRIGVDLPWQTRPYLLLGVESSRFRYSTFYIPRSAIVMGAAADLLPASFVTAKWLSGSMWGIGIEKAYKNFRFGGDIRVITYKAFRGSYATNSGDTALPVDVIVNSFKPRNVRFSLRVTYNF